MPLMKALKDRDIKLLPDFVLLNFQTYYSIPNITKTSKFDIIDNNSIDYLPKNSICRLLGYSPQVLHSDLWHECYHPAKIIKIITVPKQDNTTSWTFYNHRIVAYSGRVWYLVRSRLCNSPNAHLSHILTGIKSRRNP